MKSFDDWFWYCLIVILIAASGDTWSKNAYVVMGQSNAVGIVTYGGLDNKLDAVIINCTKGGTELNKFLPNYSIQTIYGKCIADVQATIATGNVVKGIIFWQGERDGSKFKDPDGKYAFLSWDAKFSQILAALRADLGAPLPVALVTLNTFSHSATFPYWKGVWVRQMWVKPPHCRKFDSSLYPFNFDWQYPNDEIHLTVTGFDLISQDLAKYFLELDTK